MNRFKWSNKALSLSITVSLSLWGTVIAAGVDAENGAKVFKKCASCHMVGPDAKRRSGPQLNNIIDAPAGAVDGFRYSKSLLAAAGDGLVWNFDNLDAYLKSPKRFIPKTRMSFSGLRKEADRSDVIAYLATFSEGSVTGEVVEGFSVSSEILAIEGDLEYGEYLASECTTCHQSDGGNDGIPSINGLDVEPFVTALHAYRGKHRENSVMQLVAGRLTDEEIAALAAYFKSLEN